MLCSAATSTRSKSMIVPTRARACATLSRHAVSTAANRFPRLPTLTTLLATASVLAAGAGTARAVEAPAK